MLTEALTALASAGSTALVTAMVTDGWEGTKARFVRLLSRDDTAKAETLAGRLEQSRAALVQVTGSDLRRVRVEQEVLWRTRLEDLLEQDPGVEQELRTLIAEVQATRSAGPVKQHLAAFDQAQQAVQGHGVQNVTFGPGASKRE